MIKFIKKILGIGGKSRKPKPPKDYSPNARARVHRVKVNVREYNGEAIAETKIADQGGRNAEKQLQDMRQHPPVRSRVGASPKAQRKVGIPKKGSDINRRVSLSLKEVYEGAKKPISVEGCEVVVDIPRGAASGTVVKVSGAGGYGINRGPRGDLVVTIHIIEDELFELQGHDIYCRAGILVKAGDTVEVPTVVGQITARIPERINSAKWLPLVGYGMPKNGSTDECGDLYYRFVEFSFDSRGSYLTNKGYENLLAEEKQLESRLIQLQKATEETQPRESKVKKNAEFYDLQEKQGIVISRLQQIRGALQSAQVVDLPELISNYVIFGSTVVLREEGSDELEEYQIVGAAESNPRERRISSKSPIGSAVIGKKKNSIVRVSTPDGIMRFEIVDIIVN